MSVLYPHVTWDWGTPETVYLDDYWFKRWYRKGMSDVWRAYPWGTSACAWLMKYGQDAVGEYAYFFVARQLDLPHQVVQCAQWRKGGGETPTVVLRYEARAFRPRKILPAPKQAKQAKQASGEVVVVKQQNRTVSVHNPLDFLRHIALSDFLCRDEVQCMVSRRRLFGIDAAMTGSWYGAGALNPAMPAAPAREDYYTISPRWVLT